MTRTPKRPRDPNQLAKLIVDLASGEVTEKPIDPPTPAQEFARSGGLKGGRARADALTVVRRKEIARKASLIVGKEISLLWRRKSQLSFKIQVSVLDSLHDHVGLHGWISEPITIKSF